MHQRFGCIHHCTSVIHVSLHQLLILYTSSCWARWGQKFQGEKTILAKERICLYNVRRATSQCAAQTEFFVCASLQPFPVILFWLCCSGSGRLRFRGVSVVVMCCDVMWHDATWLVARRDEVMQLAGRRSNVVGCEMSCHVS